MDEHSNFRPMVYYKVQEINKKYNELFLSKIVDMKRKIFNCAILFVLLTSFIGKVYADDVVPQPPDPVSIHLTVTTNSETINKLNAELENLRKITENINTISNNTK